jgi:TPR repeat protein
MAWQRRWTIRVVGVLLLSSCSATGPRPLQHWGTTERALESRCQGGDWAACGELGRLLVSAERTDREQERGLVLLEAACGQEDVPACTSLGIAYGTRSRVGTAGARARSLLAWACDRESAAACTGLGHISGAGGLRRLQRGCELGDGEGCERLAEAIVADSPEERGRVDALLARACRLGRLDSCRWLARLRLGRGDSRADGQALLLATCRRGHAPSCFSAAILFAPLLSEHADCARAQPLAAAACQGGEQEACAIADACLPPATAQKNHRTGCDRLLGLACLYWAEGQSETSERRLSAYRTACEGDAGHETTRIACGRLGALELAHAGNQAEAREALQQLETACRQSSGQACCELSEAYRAGIWIGADQARSGELRLQACSFGERRCCGSPPAAK